MMNYEENEKKIADDPSRTQIGTDKRDAIQWLLDRMGSEGRFRTAEKMHELLINDDLLDYNETGVWFNNLTDQIFFEYAERAQGNLDVIDEGMKRFLTLSEINAVQKRWDGKVLTNAELQTLHRIRKKQDYALSILKNRVEFFEKFDI